MDDETCRYEDCAEQLTRHPNGCWVQRVDGVMRIYPCNRDAVRVDRTSDDQGEDSGS